MNPEEVSPLSSPSGYNLWDESYSPVGRNSPLLSLSSFPIPRLSSPFTDYSSPLKVDNTNELLKRESYLSSSSSSFDLEEVSSLQSSLEIMNITPPIHIFKKLSIIKTPEDEPLHLSFDSMKSPETPSPPKTTNILASCIKPEKLHTLTPLYNHKKNIENIPNSNIQSPSTPPLYHISRMDSYLQSPQFKTPPNSNMLSEYTFRCISLSGDIEDSPETPSPPKSVAILKRK